jgi:integrase
MVSDDLTKGLYLKLSPAGSKTWLHRTRTDGKWQVVTLGKHPDMSLAQARERVARMGDIPAAGTTFGDLLAEWMAHHVEPNYKRTGNVETYVARGTEALGTRRLVTLTTSDLVAVLKRYAKAAPVSANRMLATWKQALDYAIQCGYLESNPLARTTAKVVGGKENPRDRVLTDEEIRQLWSWQGSNASLLRFLLLTGLRISEGQQGRRKGSKWRCDETKTGTPHWVHLTPLAVAQLADPFEVSATAVQSWLKRKGVTYTPHDLRRTMRTRLSALGIAPHVAERCIGHKLQGILNVYDKHDFEKERIEAAEKWADELQRIVET